MRESCMRSLKWRPDGQKLLGGKPATGKIA